jgi:hypothetical protein
MLHWTRENDGRYYTAFMCKDLFHDWVVVKAWGSKGKPKAQRQIIACKDKDEAIEVLAAITKRRLSRNYKLVDLSSLQGEFMHLSANSSNATNQAHQP